MCRTLNTQTMLHTLHTELATHCCAFAVQNWTPTQHHTSLANVSKIADSRRSETTAQQSNTNTKETLTKNTCTHKRTHNTYKEHVHTYTKLYSRFVYKRYFLYTRFVFTKRFYNLILSQERPHLGGREHRPAHVWGSRVRG